jgi:GNAT superfamily N-acetyltransferase
VLVEEIITYVEMTSPDQLRPGRPAPADVEMRYQDRASDLVRPVHDRVAGPYHWSTLSWPDAQWRLRQAQQGMHHWIAWSGKKAAGLLAVQAHPGGEAEIDMFGLVPEFVGKGYGGHILTLSVHLAWGVPPLDGTPIRRVWLHTSTLDNPNALPNYLSRGFRAFRTEYGQREVPG